MDRYIIHYIAHKICKKHENSLQGFCLDLKDCFSDEKYIFQKPVDWLKVNQFQNEFMKSSFLPKYEQKIVDFCSV